jgi:thiamine-phosphate pyrophosphorylase
MDRDRLLLYAITDRALIGSRSTEDAVESALRGGARIIQLREKGMPHDALVTEAKRVLAVCRRYGALLIVNDDYRAAIEAGADGVHVGIEDAPVTEIRALAPEGFIIGATAKTVAQAQLAERAGADYLGIGAVFPSPTKPGAIPVSPEAFREIAASVSIPSVCIGGINAENIRRLRGIGAAGAALVSAVFAGEDITANTRRMLTLCREVFR